MGTEAELPLDVLWRQYSQVFREFDDLTLARWMAQTLGQFAGKIWRLSHPLVGAYRLAAQPGHERQIWLKRLVNAPAVYPEAPCCRAPTLPLLTRDVHEQGLVCLHCNETLTAFNEIPADLRRALKTWGTTYSPVHAVAHWDTDQRKSADEYEEAYDEAAERAEKLLIQAGRDLAPRLLELYPAVIWEDQDECLEIRPEDISV